MIVKLLAFTFAMIVVPIGSYFATVSTVFKGPRFPLFLAHRVCYGPETDHPPLGNSTFAGATAAIMANVVLIAYVFVAMREDQSDQEEEKKKDR